MACCSGSSISTARSTLRPNALSFAVAKTIIRRGFPLDRADSSSIFICIGDDVAVVIRSAVAGFRCLLRIWMVSVALAYRASIGSFVSEGTTNIGKLFKILAFSAKTVGGRQREDSPIMLNLALSTLSSTFGVLAELLPCSVSLMICISSTFSFLKIGSLLKGLRVSKNRCGSFVWMWSFIMSPPSLAGPLTHANESPRAQEHFSSASSLIS
mmetsp:Transcript_11560/g.29275  ORF Transcript_11560/g.29275 Transcript_11560/m.29275 type:complete len:212 (-) Transcript_11560:204-839(-)